MKITDIIYRYPTTNAHKDGICRLRIFCANGSVYALLTEVTDNTSSSITNSIELIISSLLKNGIVPEKTLFIEHYELSQSFDIVVISKHNNTEWKPIDKDEVIKLLNCSLEEFEDPTITNNRLLNDIDRLRTEIDIYSDLPYPEDNQILKRRIEISENQISKDSIHQLIQVGANEKRFQKLLQKDMSVFGELYSRPKDDYICFSEFPIDKGFVDFVLLTGVSRMDVFLIEVKGAEFKLFNQSHYDKFSSRIEAAMHQIRERLSYITRNLQKFKEEIHTVRKKVETGSKIYSSFIGPCTHLEVDENKDINLHTIIIGGRTINDLDESRKRHDYEYDVSLNIKIESWDTWARKLRRR